MKRYGFSRNNQARKSFIAGLRAARSRSFMWKPKFKRRSYGGYRKYRKY